MALVSFSTLRATINQWTFHLYLPKRCIKICLKKGDISLWMSKLAFFSLFVSIFGKLSTILRLLKKKLIYIWFGPFSFFVSFQYQVKNSLEEKRFIFHAFLTPLKWYKWYYFSCQGGEMIPPQELTLPSEQFSGALYVNITKNLSL